MPDGTKTSKRTRIAVTLPPDIYAGIEVICAIEKKPLGTWLSELIVNGAGPTILDVAAAFEAALANQEDRMAELGDIFADTDQEVSSAVSRLRASLQSLSSDVGGDPGSAFRRSGSQAAKDPRPLTGGSRPSKGKH